MAKKTAAGGTVLRRQTARLLAEEIMNLKGELDAAKRELAAATTRSRLFQDSVDFGKQMTKNWEQEATDCQVIATAALSIMGMIFSPTEILAALSEGTELLGRNPDEIIRLVERRCVFSDALSLAARMTLAKRRKGEEFAGKLKIELHSLLERFEGLVEKA
ncbi:MAG: hypothetical protein V1489_00475 [Candidatus Liptonbacteria bacterium]